MIKWQKGILAGEEEKACDVSAILCLLLAEQRVCLIQIDGAPLLLHPSAKACDLCIK